MKIDALNHPKTIELSSQLKVPLPQAIGHLELLWAFVAQKTPRGNIGRWSDAVIAHSAMWEGDPADFTQALVVAGFLDSSGEHRLLVHDWSEHMPNWVRAKLKREKKEVLSSDLSPDLKADYKGREGKGNKTMSDSDESDEFENIWQEKPSRPNQSKQKALKAYRARIREGINPADLFAGLKRYNEYCDAEDTQPKYRMHLSTFLNADEHWKNEWKVMGKVPDDPAEIGRLAREHQIRLPENCHIQAARKLISKETGMSL